jgi:hypothetical protein
MARPSVIPAVKERLEIHLDKLETAYQSQPEGKRIATLPATNDGKVNVRALAQAIGLKQTQEKYLYEREELTSLINLVAEGQALLPIGARTMEVADKALKERLVQQAKTAKEDAQAATEARAAEQRLLDELSAALTEIEMLKAENMRLNAQLELIHAGMYVQVMP